MYTNKKHYYFYNKSTQWKGWFPPEDLLRKIIWDLSEEERNSLLDPRNILPNETEEADANDEDLVDAEEENDEEDSDDDDDHDDHDDDDEKEEEEGDSDSEHDEAYNNNINMEEDVRDDDFR